MYNNGEGVTQDYAEAVRWYRLAADRGDAVAQHNLGLMYKLGQGVTQDYVVAHMWLNLATAQQAGEDRKQSAGARDRVAEEMTSDQIAEAQRRAREWTPSPQPEPYRLFEAQAVALLVKAHNVSTFLSADHAAKGSRLKPHAEGWMPIFVKWTCCRTPFTGALEGLPLFRVVRRRVRQAVAPEVGAH